jgi:hypothetical protein
MKSLWILVLSKRGFIQEPEIFYDEHTANNRKKDLIEDFNPDYDEIEIFEKPIPT